MIPPSLAFPALLQDFFQRRLMAERGVSAHTIASYRDTFELLLRYAEQRTGRTPSALTLQDLDAPVILSFLDHLEIERSCCPRTRNLRLTAVRSFMRYVSVRDPASLAIAQRVLAIASKRFDRPLLGFLSRDEVQALLDAPDRTTWSGQRDAALFAVLYNTGARVSEIIRLHVADVLIDRAHAVHLHGKGKVCFIKHTRPNVSGSYMLSTKTKTPEFARKRAVRRFLTTHNNGSFMAWHRRILKEPRPCLIGYSNVAITSNVTPLHPLQKSADDIWWSVCVAEMPEWSCDKRQRSCIGLHADSACMVSCT